MREALQRLRDENRPTACQERPVPFTEIQQSPTEAAALCGRGTDHPCPILELCSQFGFTESVYANKMVYGGYTWIRGTPIVSETVYQARKRRRANLDVKPKSA